MASKQNKTKGFGNSGAASAAPPNPKPVTLGQPETVFDRLSQTVQKLNFDCSRASDPEQAQQFARDLDNLLKELSRLQQYAGEARREMSKHITTLRKASPKAKASGPIELVVGKIYLIDGVPKRWSGNAFEEVTNK